MPADYEVPMDRTQQVAQNASAYLLALIEIVNGEADGAVVLTALTALVAYVLAHYDIDVAKFSTEVSLMMARRAQLLAKRGLEAS